MTIDEVWHCLACGLRDIEALIVRCPSCWKDRPLMPKISTTSGPSDITQEAAQVAVDVATVAEAVAPETVPVDQAVIALATGLEVIDSALKPLTPSASETAPATPDVESSAPAPMTAPTAPQSPPAAASAPTVSDASDAVPFGAPVTPAPTTSNTSTTAGDTKS